MESAKAKHGGYLVSAHITFCILNVEIMKQVDESALVLLGRTRFGVEN